MLEMPASRHRDARRFNDHRMPLQYLSWLYFQRCKDKTQMDKPPMV